MLVISVWWKYDIIHETEDFTKNYTTIYRSSRPEVFLGKRVLKTCSKFTGEHPCWIAISGKVVLNTCSKFTGEYPSGSAFSKLQSNFIEIALWHGSSSVNLLYVFRTPFPKNNSGRLLLHIHYVKAWRLPFD